MGAAGGPSREWCLQCKHDSADRPLFAAPARISCRFGTFDVRTNPILRGLATKGAVIENAMHFHSHSGAVVARADVKKVCNLGEKVQTETSNEPGWRRAAAGCLVWLAERLGAVNK